MHMWPFLFSPPLGSHIPSSGLYHIQKVSDLSLEEKKKQKQKNIQVCLVKTATTNYRYEHTSRCSDNDKKALYAPFIIKHQVSI